MGALAFLAGGGEMGALIRAYDWAASPLGPPEYWPQGLKTSLRTALTTRHPIFIFWGPQHVCFYNDGYRASLGPEKHPAILGARGREAFDELWDIIGPQIDLVMRGEGATWHENHLVPSYRNGRRAKPRHIRSVRKSSKQPAQSPSLSPKAKGRAGQVCAFDLRQPCPAAVLREVKSSPLSASSSTLRARGEETGLASRFGRSFAIRASPRFLTAMTSLSRLKAGRKG